MHGMGRTDNTIYSSLLLSLVNTILEPKEKLVKKEQQKEHWLHCKRAHAILMDVLSLYGPEIYHPIWNQFSYFKLVSTQKADLEKDDEYSELDTKQLANYSDFWDFTDRLLNHGTKNLESKVRKGDDNNEWKGKDIYVFLE
jgi:hypothetical protein